MELALLNAGFVSPYKLQSGFLLLNSTDSISFVLRRFLKVVFVFVTLAITKNPNIGLNNFDQKKQDARLSLRFFHLSNYGRKV